MNVFFFEEVVNADGLNAYRVFAPDIHNDIILLALKSCQQELHTWGAANQVAFDAGKESQHVLSLSDPEDDSFKLLGVLFDRTFDGVCYLGDCICGRLEAQDASVKSKVFVQCI